MFAIIQSSPTRHATTLAVSRSIIPAIHGLALMLLFMGCASDVIITASPGETPGMTLGPFVAGTTVSSTSTLSVQAQNYAGFVSLRQSCCYDTVRDRSTQFPGQLVANLNATGIDFTQSPNATSTTGLTIGVATDSMGQLAVPFGKYVVQVLAQTPHGSVSTNVGAKVLPDGLSEPAPYCRPSVEVLPINSIVAIQIAASEASPRKTHLVIAVYTVSLRDTWRWEIDDFPALLPTEAYIVLDNQTDSDKAITTTGCSSGGQDLTVPSKQRAHVKIVQGVDRTIVFQRKVCNDIVCAGWHMEDVSTFSERSFWSVFGRKRMTFTWLKD